MFDNQASPSYIKHIKQNWQEETHIKGAYPNDHEDWRKIRDIPKSIDNKIFFAGTGFTDGEDWGSVHNAAASARNAVNAIVG